MTCPEGEDETAPVPGEPRSVRDAWDALADKSGYNRTWDQEG